eukprot:371137_1
MEECKANTQDTALLSSQPLLLISDTSDAGIGVTALTPDVSVSSCVPTMDENQFDLYCLEMVEYDMLSSMKQPTPTKPTTLHTNSFDMYCLDMVEYNILSLDSTQPPDPPTTDKSAHSIEDYCADMITNDIYNVQTMANLIMEAPSSLLFDGLAPYFATSALSQTTQTKLESGFVKHGINGKALRFIDKECLNEMHITDQKEQNIILTAINQIYLIFNPCTRYTLDILHKYLTPEVWNYFYMQTTQKKIELNGETLMYLNNTCLRHGLFGAHTPNQIFSAVHQVFNVKMFAAYISTFPSLIAYTPLFIHHHIDLMTFKNNAHSNLFYISIGIKDMRVIHAFKHLFPKFVTAEYITQCCNPTCTRMCILDREHLLDDREYITQFGQFGCKGYKVARHVWNIEDKVDKHIKYRLIDAEYIRIFCADCACNRTYCRYPGCRNRDMDEICYSHAHPECKECQRRAYTETCATCDAYYCTDCLFVEDPDTEPWWDETEDAKQCKSCILQQEVDALVMIVSERFYWVRIARIIAGYAVGMILTCCNPIEHADGAEEISFDTECEFQRGDSIDINHNRTTIHYYDPAFPTVYADMPTVFVNVCDQYVRIFCASCTQNKITKCVYCYEKDTNKYCANHMICCQCDCMFKSDESMNRCVGCDQFCCATCRIVSGMLCGLSCQTCVSKLRHITIYAAVHAIKPNLNECILGIITGFAMGYVFACCNQDDECNHEIVMDNIFEFIRQKAVYYYKPLYSKPNKPTISISGELYRIFCGECTSSRLEYCACRKGLESGATECGNHPLCGACSAVIMSPNVSTCCDCELPICRECVCASKSGLFGIECCCKPCSHQQEIKSVGKDILRALTISSHMYRIRTVAHANRVHIAETIASYAVGYIMQCCGDHDQISEIIFDNKASLEAQRDYKNEKIVYYDVPDTYPKHNPTVSFVGFLSSRAKRYRMFCSSCTTDALKECVVSKCYNRDMTKTCASHPECSQCKWHFHPSRPGNRTKYCGKCHECVCENCWIICGDYGDVCCEPCMTKEEYNAYYHTLLVTTNLGPHLNRIIADYATGYIFTCGNAEDKCTQDMMFRSSYQFQLKRDHSRHSIYYYQCRFRRDDKPTIVINDEEYRIFCADCSFQTATDRLNHVARRLSRCSDCNANLESGHYSVRYCCNHPTCKTCNRVILEKGQWCKQCHEYVCRSCRIGADYKADMSIEYDLCQSCTLQIEHRMYADAINAVVSIWNDTNIVDIIAQYCMGYVFNCCNSKDQCNTTIVCDNMAQFASSQDCKGRNIFYHEPEFYTASRPTVSVMWKGKNRKLRVFCFICTSSGALVRCGPCGRRNDVHRICGGHPICSNCNESVSTSGTIKCCVCYETCCQQCCYSLGYTDDIIYCKRCMKKVGYESLYGAIYEAINQLGLGFELHIIGIMMDYCIGYAFECGNKEEKCENDVVFDNMSQFRDKRDITRQTIYYYYTDLEGKQLLLKHAKPTVSFDKKQLRIFCAVCTRNRIKWCMYCRRHQEIPSKYTEQFKCITPESRRWTRRRKRTTQTHGTACLNHPVCSKCNTLSDKPCSRCRSCDAYFCHKTCCIDFIGRKYCEPCAIQKEINDWTETVSSAPIWDVAIGGGKDEICKVIATYSVGCVLKCDTSSCRNRIILNNMWQFTERRDCENNAIFWCHLTKKQRKRKLKKKRSFILRYGWMIKILCSQCTMPHVV